MMYYGLTRRKQAYEMVEDVIKVLGGGEPARKLLLETAQQETQMGEYKDPTPGGAGEGITQFDKLPVQDTINRARAEEANSIRANFGIDIYSIEHNHLGYSPLVCFILTRLKYKRIPQAIPTTVEGRAEYWKQHYNSVLGKGTVEEYIENAKKVK